MKQVDALADELCEDVFLHIKHWMELTSAEDIKFHFFRMRLLQNLNEEKNIGQKLLLLCDRITTKCRFDVAQAVKDKVMGDSVAKYIFAKIIIRLNQEYLKILDLEEDRIKAENNVVGMKVLNLKSKIEQH